MERKLRNCQKIAQKPNLLDTGVKDMGIELLRLLNSYILKITLNYLFF